MNIPDIKNNDEKHDPDIYDIVYSGGLQGGTINLIRDKIGTGKSLLFVDTEGTVDFPIEQVDKEELKLRFLSVVQDTVIRGLKSDIAIDSI